MVKFVLDASVALRWVLPVSDAETHLADYAAKVLKACAAAEIITPALWHIEVIGVLGKYEKLGRLAPAESDAFLAAVSRLPIITEAEFHSAFGGTALAASRKYATLSGYDAHYLLLAARLGVPLATNDEGLAQAASAAGVPLFLGGPKWPKAAGKARTRKLK